MVEGKKFFLNEIGDKGWKLKEEEGEVSGPIFPKFRDVSTMGIPRHGTLNKVAQRGGVR